MTICVVAEGFWLVWRSQRIGNETDTTGFKELALVTTVREGGQNWQLECNRYS